MDTATGILLSGLARTTLCTAFAASAALLLLPALGIRSTSIHRTVWLLVIVQGWILASFTITISVPSALQSRQPHDSSIKNSEPLSAVLSSGIPRTSKPLGWQQHASPTAIAAWLLGSLAILGSSIMRYGSLVTRVPVGNVPREEAWSDEWREAAGAIASRANVQFRVTRNSGPLLCFIPFVYLVLVPRLLWATLGRDDRLAILRHELVHLKRGDLWKNLTIRILALPQWFNPLVWIAVRRFEEAGEWACDEEVLASPNFANTRYASTLLRVAGFSSDSPCGTVAATGGVLTRRVTRLLSSSDKEVSRMKNLAVPFLLLAIAAAQAIRIEPIQADEPHQSEVIAKRAKAVAKWHEEPYIVEPPDILHVEMKGKDLDATIEDTQLRLKADLFHLRGEYPVEPDGTIDLMGRIHVAGMTVDETRKAIVEKHAQTFGEFRVNVEIFSFNSKVVYVIEKSGDGDQFASFPCLEDTNVLQILDAYVNDSDVTDRIDIVYIVPVGGRAEHPTDRLPVDYSALLSKRDLTTNYDLVPGDRIFVMSKD